MIPTTKPGRNNAAYAAILLTVKFNKPEREQGPQMPLSDDEYHRLTEALQHAGGEPADLVTPGHQPDREQLAHAAQIDPDRARYLLGRGVGMALKVDDWHRRGISQITIHDTQYPSALHNNVALQSRPPVLHIAGNLHLIREADPELVARVHPKPDRQRLADDLLHQVGAQLQRYGKSAVCELDSIEGKRAVDFICQEGANAIGVAAYDLQNVALSRPLRDHLMEGRLALLSRRAPHTPPAGSDLQDVVLLSALSSRTIVVRGGSNPGIQASRNRPDAEPAHAA